MIRYLYPQIFGFDKIVPVDYPFIHLKGPAKCNVMLVFDDIEAFNAYSNGDGRAAIIIHTEEQNGKQNERDRQGKVDSQVSGGRRGSQGGEGGKADGMAGRGNNDAGVHNVGSKRNRKTRG